MRGYLSFAAEQKMVRLLFIRVTNSNPVTNGDVWSMLLMVRLIIVAVIHCKNNHYLYVFVVGNPGADRKTNGEKTSNRNS
jgi:hypothetical protein